MTTYGIIGLGRVGSRLATALTSSGHPVKWLSDSDHEPAGAGERASAEEIRACDVVIECITEDYAAKVSVLGGLAGTTAAVLTTTSSFPVAELASDSGLGARLIGFHYLQSYGELVELTTAASDPDVGEAAAALAEEVDLATIEGAAPADEQPRRTGLAGARLTAVTARSGAVIDGVDAAAWPLLLGAAICGLGNALSRESVRYTKQREQFGASIASFPGLRAVVGTAYAELRRARAHLYAHAQHAAATPVADTLALAADTVVNSAIDAVQCMGGYGYIDEFPVAGMFRDAISLRARASSALSGWRSGAEFAYALEGQGK